MTQMTAQLCDGILCDCIVMLDRVHFVWLYSYVGQGTFLDTTDKIQITSEPQASENDSPLCVELYAFSHK
jgi:hypothetical protein